MTRREERMEIKQRFTGSVLKIVNNADLHGADLHGANLRDANLRGANLSDADLRDADLYGANLRDANLRGANLYSADLRGANLYGADLRGANLYVANLYGADLRDADLRGVDLREADLHHTIGNMREIKSMHCDTWNVTWTKHAVQIGCQRHTWDEWLSFDDDTIQNMDRERALDWWRKWKPVLTQIINV